MTIYIKKIALLIPLLLLLQFVNAQVSDMPKVSGIILEKGTGKRLVDVNVMNVRTKRTVTSNNFGVFYLEAGIGDSLAFTKVGYGPLKTVLYSLEDIVLEMQPGLTIEEVVVARRTRQQDMEDILKDYSKKGIYNGGKNSVGTYLGSPATALYNLFGREAKNMKRFEKFMDRELDAIAVDRIFNKTIVSTTTGLEGQELENFMEIYRPSHDQATKWGQYDLLNYITKSFKSWDDSGRPVPEKLPKLDISPQN
ncbi:hypothetical protein [Sphingobacterium bovistauri]|uniref:CarboxypepD_reg-like domain-containing protein n=1 Tax=Sphingobacterium bovistauri TaxID=2781959 RepID=A0ABS7Z8Z3_9SPHI|nr:hypothetical protein [Sphingobacterium bovistauri]MCA5006012.1 hypothetical protein [Sphingobacterium bovistauri]